VKTLTLGGGIVGLIALGKSGYLAFSMDHFKLSEFRGEHLFLSVGLLTKLDEFRERLGEPVMVSPAKGSMMRWNAPNNSQHKYGRAIDVMLPKTVDFARAFKIAKEVGFTGIGFYPHWRPFPGFHVDVRPTKKVALWGAVNPEREGQRFTTIGEAFSYV